MRRNYNYPRQSEDNSQVIPLLVCGLVGAVLLVTVFHFFSSSRKPAVDPTIPSASDAVGGFNGYHKKSGIDADRELRNDIAEAIRYEIRMGHREAYADITQYADDVRVQIHMELESKGYHIELKRGVLGTFWVISW